ncbi:MAG: FKBP-type peptidyl-prolyl cis-trans isomerase [Alphaproteobacteria bacterium]
MSATSLAESPGSSRPVAAFWLGILALIAGGIALAWFGAGAMRGETTASGLVFRTIEAGSGPFIKPVDGVMIEYEGRLRDGTVFDSSSGRGPQPMIAGQTIPGFAEALSKMQQGGRYRVMIPSNLAYGAEPPPGSVPPNSDLEFDVEVVQVVPDAALMAGSQPQQP